MEKVYVEYKQYDAYNDENEQPPLKYSKNQAQVSPYFVSWSRLKTR